MATMVGSEIAATPADLESFEKEIGCRLPNDYRDYLLRYNGGTMSTDASVLYGCWRDDHFRVGYLLGFLKGKAIDLRYNRKTFSDRVPQEFLPIACTQLGDLFCMKLTGHDLGAVFFRDHSSDAAEGEPPHIRNLHYCAANFTMFIESLSESQSE